TRVKLDAAVRSLEFILLNQPSYPPYTAFPKDAEINPDLFLSVGFDYHFPRAGFTIGPTVGIDRPASFRPVMPTPQQCGNTGGILCSPSTLVVRGEGDFSPLPQYLRDSTTKQLLLDANGNPQPVGAVPI